MGRKSHDSIIKRLGKPLPGRTNVIITRDPNFVAPAGVEVYHTIDAGLAAHTGEDIFIIGGGEIFKQTIAKADVLYVTEVQKDYPGDVFFPVIDAKDWQKTDEDPRDGFSFVTYQRLKGGDTLGK
jgi:dihydrofolate reductase